MSVLGEVCPWPALASPTFAVGGSTDYDARATTRRDMVAQPDGALEGAPNRLDTTIDLLTRARAGDEQAKEALFARCMPALRRWARGRLPGYARDLLETQDLVQDSVMHALQRLDAFEWRHQGALQAYLRQAIHHRIIDEIRRATRRPGAVELEDRHVDPSPSPLQQAIGTEGLAKYEAALERLKPSDREAIIARMELQQSYEEVAVALGKPTANAARVAVTRALAKLVEEMEAVSGGAR